MSGTLPSMDVLWGLAFWAAVFTLGAFACVLAVGVVATVRRDHHAQIRWVIDHVDPQARRRIPDLHR